MKNYDIICSDPPLHVNALPGESPAKVSDGYGGWEVVDRPSNVSFTRWVGGKPYGMQISLMLDGFASNRSITPQYLALERMARTPGGDEEPPTIRVLGPQPRGDQIEWVIEALDWPDDKLLRSGNGTLIRAEAVLTLREHIDPDLIAISAAKRRKKKPKKKKPKKKPRRR